MSWLPSKGELFYIRFLPKTRIIDSGYGVATAVKMQDGSYQENIFRLIASDDRMLVAKIAYGSDYFNNEHLFLRTQIEAMPVGPSVVAALGLSTESNT